MGGDDQIHCENCISVKGASAAYKAALRTVLSQSETKRFFSLSYGKRRSKTVHEAILHGTENKRVSGMSFSHVREDAHFNMEVERVKSVAKKVLLHSLECRAKHV